MTRISLLFVVLVSLLPLAANAADANSVIPLAVPSATDMGYPQQVFDVTYSQSDWSGQDRSRMVSDGKGHVRLELIDDDGTMTTLVDAANNSTIQLLEDQRTAVKLAVTPKIQSLVDINSIKELGLKPLLAQLVNGHPCHGFEGVVAGVPTQLWFGDDIGYVVRRVEKKTDGTVTTDLVSFSSQDPDPTMFQVPRGYQNSSLDLNGLANTMNGMSGGSAAGLP
jgi:hypothetical protein